MSGNLSLRLAAGLSDVSQEKPAVCSVLCFTQAGSALREGLSLAPLASQHPPLPPSLLLSPASELGPCACLYVSPSKQLLIFLTNAPGCIVHHTPTKTKRTQSAT